MNVFLTLDVPLTANICVPSVFAIFHSPEPVSWAVKTAFVSFTYAYVTVGGAVSNVTVVWLFTASCTVALAIVIGPFAVYVCESVGYPLHVFIAVPDGFVIFHNPTPVSLAVIVYWPWLYDTLAVGTALSVVKLDTVVYWLLLSYTLNAVSADVDVKFVVIDVPDIVCIVVPLSFVIFDKALLSFSNRKRRFGKI